MERAQISMSTFHAIQQELAVSSSIEIKWKSKSRLLCETGDIPLVGCLISSKESSKIRTRSKAPCILRRKFFSSKRFQLSNIVEGSSTRFGVHISCSAVQHVLALTLCSTGRLSKLVISAYLVAFYRQNTGVQRCKHDGSSSSSIWGQIDSESNLVSLN